MGGTGCTPGISLGIDRRIHSASTRMRSMLVGRSAERRRLVELLDRARAGESQAAVILGEPGIGKTALLEFCVARAHGFLVLRTRGTESEAELPFAGLTELLRPITRYLGDIPAPQSAALAAAFGVGPQVPSDPFAVFLGTLSLLAAAGERQPLLVVIDDAHWLDPSSQNAVLFAARRIHAEGIALVIGTRSDPEGAFAHAGVPAVSLRGLEPGDAEKLVRQTTGATISAEVAARLVTAARGNPLALIEVSRD